jgi:hypothetical protein
MGRKLIDICGKTFGDYLVLAPTGIKKKTSGWLCRCSCGREVEVLRSNLTSGKSMRCKECKNKRAGHYKITHGASRKGRKTPEYGAWRNMKDRCLNPRSSNYPDWGDRGITVYPHWIDDFSAFLDYIGPRPSPKHTLDRINNDGNYEPGNVRWATKTQQSRNQRSNVRVMFLGKEGQLCDVCDHFDLPAPEVRRLKWDRNISWIEALNIVYSKTRGPHPIRA